MLQKVSHLSVLVMSGVVWLSPKVYFSRCLTRLSRFKVGEFFSARSEPGFTCTVWCFWLLVFRWLSGVGITVKCFEPIMI